MRIYEFWQIHIIGGLLTTAVVESDFVLYADFFIAFFCCHSCFFLSFPDWLCIFLIFMDYSCTRSALVIICTVINIWTILRLFWMGVDQDISRALFKNLYIQRNFYGGKKWMKFVAFIMPIVVGNEIFSMDYLIYV